MPAVVHHKLSHYYSKLSTAGKQHSVRLFGRGSDLSPDLRL